MRSTLTIAMILSAITMLGTACSAEVEEESTLSVSQKLAACGFAELETAVCDRSAVLGTCTELRTEGIDLNEAKEVCEASDGVFMQGTHCPRNTTLLGVCPVEEQPMELRLHYYYSGEIFTDSTIPTTACSALNEGCWCSAQ